MRLSCFFCGINGAGKTTLLNEVAAKYPDIEIFKGSSRLMERLGIKQGDYRSLQDLPDEIKDKAVRDLMEEVLTKGASNDPLLIIDAHLIHYKRGELIDVTGSWMRHVSAIFIISTEPSILLNRIESDMWADKGRRDLFPVGLIHEEKLTILRKYHEATMWLAQNISRQYGIPLFVIENNQENIEFAFETFSSFYKMIYQDKEKYLYKPK